MTTGLFAAIFVPIVLAAAALGVAAYRLCRADGPLCWRCGARTDHTGVACGRCLEQIHAERKRRMGRSTIDGRTGLPVER